MRLQKQEARTAAKYEKAKPSVFAAVQDKIPDGLRDKLELPSARASSWCLKRAKA